MLYHSKMTMAAMKDPYHSVDAVYPLAIDGFKDGRTVEYVGVKNTVSIPQTFLDGLEKTGKYRIHTRDGMAYGGRGIDVLRVNPVTGRPMTGSSSGTAMNVFLHFNDVGIGTDGGGSVLSPAISLNLFGFISPLIESDCLKQYEKTSTDGMTFTPAIGYMARQYHVLKTLIEATLPITEDAADAEKILFWDQAEGVPDKKSPRDQLVPFVSSCLKDHDCICSLEGPIDLDGIGDTVFGHFDLMTQNIQMKSEKGLVRIANMAGATAICVPRKEFAQSFLFLCASEPDKIAKMLKIAEKYVVEQDVLITRYFGNLDQYF